VNSFIQICTYYSSIHPSIECGSQTSPGHCSWGESLHELTSEPQSLYPNEGVVQTISCVRPSFTAAQAVADPCPSEQLALTLISNRHLSSSLSVRVVYHLRPLHLFILIPRMAHNVRSLWRQQDYSL